MAKKRKKINPRVLLVIGVLGVILAGFIVAFVIQRLPQDPSVDIEFVETEVKKDKPDWIEVFKRLGKAISNTKDETAVANLLFRKAELHEEILQREHNLSQPEQEGHRRGYRGALEQAIRKDNRHLKARKKLSELEAGRAYHHPKSSKNWLDYIQVLDGILSVDPQDAETYARRGEAYRQLAIVTTNPQYQTHAVEDLRKAVELEKTKVEYWDLLARYLTMIDRTSEAEQVFREAIQANPNKALLRVSYSRFLKGQRRLEEARKMVREAIQCEPSSPLGYLDQAGDEIIRKQFDQAEASLRKAQKIDPTDPQVYAQFVTLNRFKRDSRAAIDVVREGLAALDKQDAQAKDDDKGAARRRGQIRAILNFLLADSLLEAYTAGKDEEEKKKLLAEVKQCYQILDTLGGSAVQKNHIRGRIAYFEQRWPEARTALEQVVGQNLTPQTAIMLLNVYRQLGIPGRSEKLAERILEDRTLAPALRFRFLLELAQLRLDLGEYDQAQAIVTRAKKIDPDNEIIERMQQAIDAYRGKTENLYSDKQGVNRVTRSMLFRRVQDMMLNDQMDQAQALLEDMLRHDPHDMQVLLRLLALLVENQKQDEALEQVKKSRELEPDNEDLKRFEALLNESSEDKRYEIEMGFVDKTPTDDELNKALQKWNIAYRYRKGEDAEKFLKQAEEIDPNNNLVVRLRFQEALGKKDWTAAEEYIERIQEGESGVERDQQRARLAMARGQEELVAGKKDQAEAQFNKALGYLETVVKNAPHLPIPRLLMAECYKKLDRSADALKQYRECYENNPRNLAAIKGLAELAQQEGRTSERDRWVEEAYKLPAGKMDPDIQEMYFQILSSDPQNFREVIHRRELVLKRDPKNLRNAAELAELYEKTGQINRAEEMIEYVFQGTTNKILVAPTLANLYRRMNKPTKADEMFSGLLQNAETDEEKVLARVAYADFLAPGDEDAALRMYEKAVAEEGDKGVLASRALSNFRAAQAQKLHAQGRRSESQNRWEESLDLLQKIVERRAAALETEGLSPEEQKTREQQLHAARLDLFARYGAAEQYEKAITGYRQMIQENPEDTQARLGLGLAYLQEDQLEKAKEQFDEVIKINPDLPEAYLFRSRVYQSRMDLLQAAADVSTCANLTKNVGQKMDLARIYEAMGDTEQAGRVYDAILADNPEYFPAYRSLLNLLFRQKRWSALDTLARKAMDVFPDNPTFAEILASAAEEQGDKDNQRHWLEQSATIAPNHPGVVRQYWMHLLRNRDYVRLQRETRKYGQNPNQSFGAQAVEVAAQAKRNPDDGKSFQAMLSLLHSAKNPSDVRFVVQLMNEAYGVANVAAKAPEIVKTRPNDWNLFAAVGDACYQDKKYPQAEQYFQEALKQCEFPAETIRLHLRLAQLYGDEGKYKKTEEQYRAILKDDPNNIIALNNLAYTCIDQLNRPDEGLKLIQRAMKVTPGDPNLVDTYAWALAKLERFEEAREMIEKVAGISGAGSADRQYHLGYVLEKTGSTGEARKYYRQALEMARAEKRTVLQATIEAAMANLEQK
ncbi:MAG: tetratricopeptide repeat protein [Phycisphaerae bacterium]|nr:tetratricopeptide repeat protein [Phycisphaerae bacterium]